MVRNIVNDTMNLLMSVFFFYLTMKTKTGFEYSQKHNHNLWVNTHRSLEKYLNGWKPTEILKPQGLHFTHISYRLKLKNNGVTQSMSRKGNCIDNTPIESFFGHLKDLLELEECKNIIDIQKEVTKKINYYNHRRPQLGLKKMPPSEYRRLFDS